MKAFSRAGNISEVLRLYHEMKQSNVEPNIPCYTTVIDALVAANRPVEAEEVFREMIDSGVEPDNAAYTIMVKLYSCYLKRFDSAYEVIRWMVRRGCDPDVVTYSTLITGLCRAGRVTEAWAVLDQMLERNCTPNAHCYSPILQAYCSEGKIDAAKRLMESMRNMGCSVDAVTYNILINGLCKIGKFEEVESLLKDSVSKGWKPNAVTYNTYINGLCKVRKAEKAFEQLEIMLGKGLCPTIVTLNILLDNFCQVFPKVWEGKHILERSSELGLEVDVVSYKIVMSRLCENGKWLGVLKLFTDMLKKGIRPDTQTFNILIYSLCKGGKFQKAICIFRSKGFVADIVTCNILIHEFYMVERINELCLLFSNLDMEKNAPDMVTYNTLVDCLCRNGKFLEAVNFVRSLEDGFPSEPVAHLTYWLVRGGKLVELLRVFEEMSKQGLVLDVRIFNFLIKAFCRIGSCQNGEITKVSFILEKMLGIG
ncbi:pentatricopeptide repeat-containing protein, mitochondrial [Cocos nucifera]|nr:pentatricopeptide repeat-containing protein, mitochondrial [Cocos nucifera]